ncbi:MAG: hypothetical protein JRN26_02410 [Nitrososphaerota archaeon]|jgi:hypothetical protein|nr:hypothetical protein [Nitrososphaerota archaeon]MDG6935728.1 hypothetical protein [Nitrososphaerota archaeon]MDG6943796.1 hypothetical protein [Nitrososphaerota archaeon]
MVEDKKKKESAAQKSGEEVGKATKKGAEAVKGFGKGLVKGIKGKEDKKEK